MNRIIKFRVWDNKQKRMFLPITDLRPENPDDFNYPSLCQEFDTSFIKLLTYQSFPFKYYFSDDCVIQQFTGLLDKNDQEIYEGDLVNFYAPGIPHGPEREDYQNEEVWFCPKATAFVFGKWEFHPYEIKDIEIVGNIFQNNE